VLESAVSSTGIGARCSPWRAWGKWLGINEGVGASRVLRIGGVNTSDSFGRYLELFAVAQKRKEAGKKQREQRIPPLLPGLYPPPGTSPNSCLLQ